MFHQVYIHVNIDYVLRQIAFQVANTCYGIELLHINGIQKHKSHACVPTTFCLFTILFLYFTGQRQQLW